jgi:hypothetical protein
LRASHMAVILRGFLFYNHLFLDLEYVRSILNLLSMRYDSP